jgi:hypothetical protein
MIFERESRISILLIVAGSAACNPSLALAPQDAAIEIVVDGLPADGIASVVAFIEDTHPPYNRIDQHVLVGGRHRFENLGAGFDIRFGLRNLGQHRCSILDGRRNGLYVSDSTDVVKTRSATTENIVFLVRCRPATVDVVVSGLPSGDSARVVLAPPGDTIVAHFRNGSRAVAVTSGPVDVLPDLVNGSDGFAYDAAPQTVAAQSAQTTTARLDYGTSVNNQAGVEIRIRGLPDDPGLDFRAFIRSLTAPVDADSATVAMDETYVFPNRPAGVQYHVMVTGLTAHRCQARVNGIWTLVGDTTSTTITTRRAIPWQDAYFELLCHTGALDVVVAGLPPGDSAWIDVDGFVTDARLHVPNGTWRVDLVPYLTRILPQGVAGSNGLTYAAAPDTVTLPSRQTRTVTVQYAAAQPGSISGTVTGNGNGIVGATVTLSGGGNAVATTANGGAYAFPSLAPGTYTLTVDSPFPGITFPSSSQTVTLAPGQNLIVNFAGTYQS